MRFQGTRTFRNHKQVKVTKILAEEALQSMICVDVLGARGLGEQ